MLFLPRGMPLAQYGFDLGFVCAGSQYVVTPASGQIHSSIVIGMVLIATDATVSSSYAMRASE